MTTTLTQSEIAKAVRSIISTDVDKCNDEYLIVSNKEDAQTISELLLQDGKGGVITGPYLQPINGYPQRVWNISK